MRASLATGADDGGHRQAADAAQQATDGALER